MNKYVSITEKIVELASDGFVKRIDNQFYMKASVMILDFNDRTIIAMAKNKKELVVGRLTSTGGRERIVIAFPEEMLLPITIE